MLAPSAKAVLDTVIVFDAWGVGAADAAAAPPPPPQPAVNPSTAAAAMAVAFRRLVRRMYVTLAAGHLRGSVTTSASVLTGGHTGSAPAYGARRVWPKVVRRGMIAASEA
ncbi:hypothetical protein GCM10011579_062400 [Streptomyces albiflavescens]|uniref:Uncharacterized protein n=1 Tax=Streptomyces albiflavescens TaxID=1623582 RepID=A0A918D7X8_9ACTN|nr:hypothetical protein GCM10011579_062400 [Streptomyces albiflavescens]